MIEFEWEKKQITGCVSIKADDIHALKRKNETLSPFSDAIKLY